MSQEQIISDLVRQADNCGDPEKECRRKNPERREKRLIIYYSNEQIWDILEDYFLGKIPEIVLR